MDNLDCHQSNRTKKYAKSKWCKARLGFTPANCTDVVSVTDQLTHIWKVELQKEYEEWADENFEEWSTNKTTASQRRILFAKWVSAAWKRMQSRSELINKMFVKCGYTLRLDGSDDDKVKIDGYDDYKLPW